jgi:hypothetical protein
MAVAVVTVVAQVLVQRAVLLARVRGLVEQAVLQPRLALLAAQEHRSTQVVVVVVPVMVLEPP